MDPVAVSAIRHRAIYGESILEALSRGIPPKKPGGKLLRMYHLMIPAADRSELPVLARRARRGGISLVKDLRVRDALLEPDIGLDGPPDEESSEEPFNECHLLAIPTLIGMDLSLPYGLPVLHMIGVLCRLSTLQDTERKHYRPLTDKEMPNLYPRPKKKAAPRGGAGG